MRKMEQSEGRPWSPLQAAQHIKETAIPKQAKTQQTAVRQYDICLFASTLFRLFCFVVRFCEKKKLKH
jgi:hypothetical protein